MKRASPTEIDSSVLKDLEKVNEECDICQRHMHEPGRFRVSMPKDEIVFNRTVLLDLMFIFSNPILHMIDEETNFSGACFVPKQTTEAVWKCFVTNWVLPYIGYPINLKTDQGRQFQSSEWESYLISAGINKIPTGVESHNALGAGERYHKYLRKIVKR